MEHNSPVNTWNLGSMPIDEQQQGLLQCSLTSGNSALTKHDPGCHGHPCAFMNFHVHALVQQRLCPATMSIRAASLSVQHRPFTSSISMQPD